MSTMSSTWQCATSTGQTSGRCSSAGPLPIDRARGTVVQLCSALAAAHARELLHRDIKPENVLIGGAAEDHAYLADFGLAKPAREKGYTKTGELVGSVDYVSPEVIGGEQPDTRTDIYALGCLLYACLTGEHPFRKDRDVATMWAHMHEAPPLPSAHDRILTRFDSIVERALAKDPDARFQSAAELGEAVADTLEPVSRPRLTEPAESNLPRPTSSFVGRRLELSEVRARLRSGARLLTLTGPGGTGKTRLAIEAAGSLVDEYRDGVKWVGLASVRDPELVASAIAQAVGATAYGVVVAAGGPAIAPRPFPSGGPRRVGSGRAGVAGGVAPVRRRGPGRRRRVNGRCERLHCLGGQRLAPVPHRLWRVHRRPGRRGPGALRPLPRHVRLDHALRCSPRERNMYLAAGARLGVDQERHLESAGSQSLLVNGVHAASGSFCWGCGLVRSVPQRGSGG